MRPAPGFLPGVLGRSRLEDIVLVAEEDAFRTCREMAEKAGVLVGISSGASVCAALRLAREPRHEGHVIVCMLCDSGERYLSVEGLFDG